MRRKLNMFMVVGLGLGAVVPDADASSLEEGLIAWWRMELRQGSTIPDASGYFHDLTVNGSPAFEGSIVTFNDDGTLEAADSDALDLMGDWTVSYWVREDSHDHSPNSNPTNGFIDKHRSLHDAEGGWFVNSDNGNNVYASIYGTGDVGPGNCVDRTPEGLVLGTWYRLTTTYDVSTHTVRIYFDDQLKYENEGTCPLRANVYPVVIGGFLEFNLTRVPFCKAAMSDIRIYDRTLSDSEVEELFAMGSPDDSDGDGVPNEDDKCPDSDLTATIVLVECDTDVENQMLEDGCTMADMITECSEGVESHGAFVRCVAHLTNLWKCEGLITGGEKGAIQSCAGGSGLP